MNFTNDQVVRVEVGSTVPNSGKGDPRWTLGTVVNVSLSRSEYGHLVTVDISPDAEAGSSLVKRYSGASRIQPGSMEDAQALVAARDQKKAEVASLAAQTPTSDARDFEARCARVQSVNLRSNTSGKAGNHSTLTEVKLGAIFQHPQVLEQLSKSIHADGAQLRAQLSGTIEALDLAQTSLRSCDHERRHLLQKNAELEGKVARLQARPQVQKCSPNQLIASAGLESGKGFILWNPKSTKPPQVTYPTYAEAKRVREIMAKRLHGEVFHICAVGEGLKLRVVTTTNEVYV